MQNTHLNIAFIGAGNMAKSIVGGLIANAFPANKITLCAPNESTLAETAALFGNRWNTNNRTGTKDANIIVLAVKPVKITEVCREIAPTIDPNTLVLSVAAGVTCDAMEAAFGRKQPIIRCMPNTPSLVSQGAAGLFANPTASPAQKRLAEEILESVGMSCWVNEESLINTVTAVSGSGPAYYFLVMEAMIDAAQAQGLDKDTATRLTLQTALGAAVLAKENNGEVTQLRQKVTSPNGTTEKAIESLEHDGLRELFATAMSKAEQRAEELASEFV